MGRRGGGGVLLYIKENIPAYEVQLWEEADYNEAIWYKLVRPYRTYNSYHWSSISLSQHNQTEQRKIHNAISEVSKGDSIIMGDFNHGNNYYGIQGAQG